MPSIHLENVSLDYPIYDAVSRSFKGSITRGIPVGGQIQRHTRKRTSILALDDISISFEEGDRVALFGHNGAGKTSMLKLLAGFYEPTSGTVVCDGKVSVLLEMMAGMDMNLNGYDNILVCGMLRGLDRTEIKNQIDEIAGFSELGPYLDMPVRLYSQGMLLRLAFSICSSIDYEILIMDEWFGTGDMDFIQKAKQRLSKMIFRTAILIFATHNSEVAKQICNKAVYMEHGKILLTGNIDDVIAFQAARAQNQSDPEVHC